uniref:Reverse transcriptase Ty1/copia-type domain-containing protein n=1 Tax=Heterorhabditis bacteriophora TaxID=37862 RepID=A0A1I7X4B7_HETBA
MALVKSVESDGQPPPFLDLHTTFIISPLKTQIRSLNEVKLFSSHSLSAEVVTVNNRPWNTNIFQTQIQLSDFRRMKLVSKDMKYLTERDGGHLTQKSTPRFQTPSGDYKIDWVGMPTQISEGKRFPLIPCQFRCVSGHCFYLTESLSLIISTFKCISCAIHVHMLPFVNLSSLLQLELLKIFDIVRRLCCRIFRKLYFLTFYWSRVPAAVFCLPTRSGRLSTARSYLNLNNTARSPETASPIICFQQTLQYQELLTTSRNFQHALATRRAETTCQYEIAKLKNKHRNEYSVETESNIEREIPRDNSVEDISDITRLRNSHNHELHKDNGIKPIKTPHLSIPKFNGNVEDFEEFWGMFEILVHQNRELSNMEKIMYLKDSLIIIQGIRIKPENYEWMVSTVQAKFKDIGRNRLAIITRLADLPPAGSAPEECDETLDS